MIDNDRARVGFGLLLSLLLLTAAGKAVLYDTIDPDCWWHIRVGEQLQREGIGPIVDTLSFASVKTPWTPYSWLAEIGMSKAWALGGFRAAIAGQAIFVGTFFLFVTLTCLEITQPPRPYVGIILAIAFGEYLALPYLSFRPATMSITLLSIIAWLIARDRRMGNASRAVWLVIPLTILNINFHMFAIVAPLMCAAAAIDAWRAKVAMRRAIALTIAISFACLMTPMLPGLITSLFNYSAADPMVSANAVAELRPFYSGSFFSLTSGLLLGATICFIVRRAKYSAGDWLLLTCGCVGICRMGRLAPIFVIVAAPMLALGLNSMHGKVLERRPISIMMGLLLIVGCARFVATFPTRDASMAQWLNRQGPEAPGYPCGAAEFVAKNITPTRGRLINDFNAGGYLAWQLGPSFQVFMDPRTQLYTPGFWKRTCLDQNDEELAGALRDADADAAIVPITSARLKNAVERLGWKQVYKDDRAAVFVPIDSRLAALPWD